MEVREALRKRRSIRRFTEEPVSKEDIRILLEAAMSAPSACNKKPWEFFVVTDPAHLEKLQSAARYTDYKAKLAIVVCGNLSRALKRQLEPYWIQDCSAATENILVQAVELGLGTVWCGIYPQEKAEENVRAALGLDACQVPLNIIYIGYPNEVRRGRVQFDESVVHYV